MGQVLHGCATTTEAIRRTIQNSQESLRALSKRYGINPKTVVGRKCSGCIQAKAIYQRYDGDHRRNAAAAGTPEPARQLTLQRYPYSGRI